jgi:hypothetical protein
MSGSRVRRIMIMGILSLVMILGAACGSDTDDAPAASQPTTSVATATSEPAASATVAATGTDTTGSSATSVATTATVAATQEPTAEPTEAAASISYTARGLGEALSSCTPGMSADEQKNVLIDIGEQLFDGATAHDGETDRLHYAPDARDRRQGGVWLVIEYNGDEAATVAEKKAGIDSHMRDAYEILFNAGCDELTQVDIGARMVATGAGVIGPMTQTLAVVFKTRMQSDDAAAINWADKDTIDFSQVWNELLLNRRWRDELQGD